MAVDGAEAPKSKRWWPERAAIYRAVRLITGLVLLFYVATHLLNHALGLISLELLNDGAELFRSFWRPTVPTVILYGSLVIHALLALQSIYKRRRLRSIPAWEAWQLILGLTVPVLLLEHLVGTRIANELYGVEDSYAYVLLAYFRWDPLLGLQQALLLLVAWAHGCIGMHFWLRIRAWYQRWQLALYTFAVVLPTAALAGMLVGGLQILALANDPQWLAGTIEEIGLPTSQEAADLYWLRDWIFIVLGALLALTLAMRGIREIWQRRRGRIRVTYPDGMTVRIPEGTTVLEASRSAEIAHASICGGRGRCSTCRIRLGAGHDLVPDPGPEEIKVLQRVAAPPRVRLACQLRPLADLEVTPLLPPHAPPQRAHQSENRVMHGEERQIAVLFADLRGFTQLSEHKLPYDVVFLLNRYFREMGLAIEGAGGYLDKFIGDGIMALFGIADPQGNPSRDALDAARAMGHNLNRLNRSLKNDLDQPLRIGIGIHFGPAIVGEMGFARATSITAIGDTVNTASRLEGLTKENACQLIVSESVSQAAGYDLTEYPVAEVPIRGREQPMQVRLVEFAETIPAPPLGSG